MKVLLAYSGAPTIAGIDDAFSFPMNEFQSD